MSGVEVFSVPLCEGESGDWLLGGEGPLTGTIGRQRVRSFSGTYDMDPQGFGHITLTYDDEPVLREFTQPGGHHPHYGHVPERLHEIEQTLTVSFDVLFSPGRILSTKGQTRVWDTRKRDGITVSSGEFDHLLTFVSQPVFPPATREAEPPEATVRTRRTTGR